MQCAGFCRAAAAKSKQQGAGRRPAPPCMQQPAAAGWAAASQGGAWLRQAGLRRWHAASMSFWGDNPTYRLEVDATNMARKIANAAPTGSLAHYCAIGVMLLCVLAAVGVIRSEIKRQADEQAEREKMV
jgi:hypothetical protein